MNKKLCVPIVNRSNYSKLSPIFSELTSDTDICLILSSSILLERFGNAYKDIASCYDIGARIDINLMSDSVEAMAKSSAMSMLEHASAYARLKPDAVLVMGDRFDMLPAAMSAHMMNIPI